MSNTTAISIDQLNCVNTMSFYFLPLPLLYFLTDFSYSLTCFLLVAIRKPKKMMKIALLSAGFIHLNLFWTGFVSYFDFIMAQYRFNISGSVGLFLTGSSQLLQFSYPTSAVFACLIPIPIDMMSWAQIASIDSGLSLTTKARRIFIGFNILMILIDLSLATSAMVYQLGNAVAPLPSFANVLFVPAYLVSTVTSTVTLILVIKALGLTHRLVEFNILLIITSLLGASANLYQLLITITDVFHTITIGDSTIQYVNTCADIWKMYYYQYYYPIMIGVISIALIRKTSVSNASSEYRRASASVADQADNSKNNSGNYNLSNNTLSSKNRNSSSNNRQNTVTLSVSASKEEI